VDDVLVPEIVVEGACVHAAIFAHIAGGPAARRWLTG
jgi:hypothetical protein